MNRRTPDKPRFVAGSIGPTNRQLSIAGNVNDPGYRSVTFDEMVATYYEQIAALVEGGVDILLAETAFDTLVLKACLFAIEKFFEEQGSHVAASLRDARSESRRDSSTWDGGARLPVMASVTITDRSGRTLSGQALEAFWTSISHGRLLERGHQFPIRSGADAALCGRIGPDRTGVYQLPSQRGTAQRVWRLRRDPRKMARTLAEFAERGWLNIVGGCCGTRRSTFARSPGRSKANRHASRPILSRSPASAASSRSRSTPRATSS